MDEKQPLIEESIEWTCTTKSDDVIETVVQKGSENNNRFLISKNTKCTSLHDGENGFIFSSAVLVFGMCFITFSLCLYALTLTQYVYSYFAEYHFPNSSLSENSEVSCDVNKSSEIYNQRVVVQEESAELGLFNSLVSRIPGIGLSLCIGSLSDRFGRKLLLNFVFIGCILQGVTYILVIHFDVYVYYTLIGSAISACSGGFYAGIAIAFAYLSDTTKAGKQRTFAIVLLEISLGLGATLCGFVSGYLIESIGYKYAMTVAVSVLTASLTTINLFTKETRSKTVRQQTSVSENLQNVLIFFTRDISVTSRRWKYTLCMLIFIAACFGTLIKSEIDTLYVLNTPFCWTTIKIGWYSSARVLSMNILGGVAMKLFHLCRNISNETVAVMSSLSNVGACVLQALANIDIMMFMVPVVGVLSLLTIPIMRSIMSRMTPSDKQGAIFASMSSMEIMALFIGEVSANAIYRATVDSHRGVIYFVFGGYNAIAIFLIILLIIWSKGENGIETSQKIAPSSTDSNV